MASHIAIYARTSLDYPVSAEEQVKRLLAVAAERRWTVAKVCIDRPTTVRKRLEDRPGEATLVEAIVSGTIERVVVPGIDLLAAHLMS